MVDVTNISLPELAATLPARLGPLCLASLRAAGIDDHRAHTLAASLAGDFVDPADPDRIIAGACNAIGAVATGWPDLDLPHTIAAGQAVAHLASAMCGTTRAGTLYGATGRIVQ